MGTCLVQEVTLSYGLPLKGCDEPTVAAQGTRCPHQQVRLGHGRDRRGGDWKTWNARPPVGLPHVTFSAAGGMVDTILVAATSPHCPLQRGYHTQSPSGQGREAHGGLGNRGLASLTESIGCGRGRRPWTWVDHLTTKLEEAEELNLGEQYCQKLHGVFLNELVVGDW